MSGSARRLPEKQQKALRRTRWLQVIWLVALSSIIAAMYFALGSSQAMKTAWIEDLLSFVPPVAFLVASWIEDWPPSDRFPLGFIRVTSIGYLVSAVALGGVGLFLIVDSSMALIQREHPTIGSVEMFGVTLWLGWLMIAALLYSVVLPVIFGRLKMRHARELNDKILFADALMNKADWMTGAAAIAGVLGIGLGWWWADAVAAMVIALDVLHDGVKHTGAAIRDLSDEMPRTIDDRQFDPLTDRLQNYVSALPWVRDSRLRLRHEGRFLTGTVYVVPWDGPVSPERVENAEAEIIDLDWRIHDVSIMPRTRLEDPATGREGATEASPPRAGAVRRRQ
jgi:cation diffusion facilitator family transporter